MPENFCPDRFKPADPIDQEANNLSRLLQNGSRTEASARLQQDIQSMGPTKFMTLVGETRVLANLSGSMTNLEVTTTYNGQVQVSLVTEDRAGRQLGRPETIVQIDNNEGFILFRPERCEPAPPRPVPCEPPRPVPCEPPRPVPCEPPRPVPCEPAPPVLCEPPPHMRIPPPWERPCPPQGGGNGWSLDIDFNLKNIFAHIGGSDNRYPAPRREPHYNPPHFEPRYQPPPHYEPTNYDPRRYDARGGHSDNNRGDGNVIVNNYVNVQGGDAKSTNRQEPHRQETHQQDPHRRTEKHK